MTKYCGQCKTTKPITDFTKAKRSSNNYRRADAVETHVYCKVCNAHRAKEWRKKNPNYRGSGKILAIPKEDRRMMSALRSRLSTCRGRIKKYNMIPTDLTDTYLYELYIAQNKQCALTGATLLTEKEHPLTVSLDQIKAGQGYIIGNVQLIAWCVNRAKGDLDTDHFYEMCEVVLEYRKVQRLSLTGVGSSDPKRGTPAMQDEDIVCSA